jgi:hypothetical protein
VVGAVLLARRTRVTGEIVDPGQPEREAELAARMAEAEARVNGHHDDEALTADDADEADEGDEAEKVTAGPEVKA